MRDDVSDREKPQDDELELEPEALKDLAVRPEDGDDVAGGATTPGRQQCYNGTW